jgi:hypothetical protein
LNASSLPFRTICELLITSPQKREWSALDAIDWPSLAQLAVEEGVAPLIHRSLKSSLGVERIPEPARTTLQIAAYSTAAQNLILLRELERLVRCLGQAGVPVILLKGAALAFNLYEEPGLRPMNDLDLLVHAADLERASHAIKQAGYRQQKTTYHRMFVGGTGQAVTLELHWNLVTEPRHLVDLSDEWYWKNAQQWVRKNFPLSPVEALPEFGNAWQLAPADEVLYLMAHLAYQHGCLEGRLIWFYDLFLLLEASKTNFDWEALVRQSKKLGWEQAVGCCVNGLHELFGYEILEPSLVRLLENMPPPPGRNHIPGADPVWAAAPGWVWAAYRSLDWPGRLRLMLGLFLPSPEYMRWRYHPNPAWLLPAYYPVRWGHLLSAGLDSISRSGSFSEIHRPEHDKTKVSGR